MENFHVIDVKFIGPSNTRGARVKMTSYRFKESVTIGYEYTFSSCAEVAAEYLKDIGFEIVGQAENADGYYLITSTFESIKKP